MGTKSLSIIIQKNEVKVAQLGYNNGYPSYMGIIALSFARDKIPSDSIKYQYFIEKLNQCILIDSEEFEENHQMDEINNYYEFFDDLSGAEIFNEILVYNTSKKICLQNHFNFAAHSLCCEWGYLIDLDNETFEIYKGNNKYPLSENERFYDLDNNYSGFYSDLLFKLYPIKLLKKYSLKDLPSNEDFLKELQKLESM